MTVREACSLFSLGTVLEGPQALHATPPPPPVPSTGKKRDLDGRLIDTPAPGAGALTSAPYSLPQGGPAQYSAPVGAYAAPVGEYPPGAQ